MAQIAVAVPCLKVGVADGGLGILKGRRSRSKLDGGLILQLGRLTALG